MMLKRKISVLLLCLMLVLTAAACSNKPDEEGGDPLEEQKVADDENSAVPTTDDLKNDSVEKQNDDSDDDSKEDSDGDGAEGSDSASYNGTYLGQLESGIIEKITISNYDASGFDFIFDDESISGHADFEDDGYAYYYDEDGQAINFEFNDAELKIDGGTTYGSLAANYTKE